MRIDWPPTDGLVLLVQKHGQGEAARRLGVTQTSLQAHLQREGVPPEQRRKQRQPVADEALKEIRDLLNGN